MPDPKLPNSGKGWIIVILATVAAMITEYIVINTCKKMWP